MNAVTTSVQNLVALEYVYVDGEYQNYFGATCGEDGCTTQGAVSAKW